MNRTVGEKLPFIGGDKRLSVVGEPRERRYMRSTRKALMLKRTYLDLPALPRRLVRPISAEREVLTGSHVFELAHNT